MLIIEKIIIVITIFIFVFFLKKLLEELFPKPKKKFRRKRRKYIRRKKVFLTSKTKVKAEQDFQKLLAKFKRKHKRKPSKGDLFWIIVQASHFTIRYRKGLSGHWWRQKVRKYLLEKHKVVKKYKMR